MIRSTTDVFNKIEAQKLPLNEALQELRGVTLDEFGELLLHLPNPDFPYLSSILPKATPDEIQKEWTGDSGKSLLRSSVNFVSWITTNYQQLSGRSITQASVLDFGCGWGRLLRLMLYFNNPDQLFGCDAWDVSLGHARAANIPATLAKSDALPSSLPFNEKFDLIYAFSVFTHLSEAAAHAALGAMRKSMRPDGVAVITLRHEGFWSYAAKRRGADYSSLMREHNAKGFAFLPSQPGDTNATYGDASMSPEYFKHHFPQWKIDRMGTTFLDEQQVFVCLRPA